VPDGCGTVLNTSKQISSEHSSPPGSAGAAAALQGAKGSAHSLGWKSHGYTPEVFDFLLKILISFEYPCKSIKIPWVYS